MMAADPADDFRSLPPSAKAIRVTLKLAGPCSWTELKDHTRLPESTLNDGLDALDDAGRLAVATPYRDDGKYELAE